MKPISLKDIQPQGATFSLELTGKEYRLRPFTLRDDVWLRETFGEELKVIFDEMRMGPICRIVFHQMEEADKADFAQRKVTIMNEEGETVEDTMGGYHLLFSMISGWSEKTDIFLALMKTVGISKALIDPDDLMGKAAKAEGSEKKSQQKPKSTGPSSSTGSRASTAGRPNTSGRGPKGKSAGVSKQ